MTRRERLQFLLAWLALGVLPLFLRPLWEPDEVRYAQIPLEMLAKGDWMTPTLNGVLYFEKPPFQYWLTAVSLKLFGTGAAAARLPLALASLLSMAAAFLLARRLGARRPVWAAFMAASALLGFFCAQALTLDALFSALIVASLACAVEAVTARVQGRAHLLWTLGAFLALALALLTKGLAAPVLLGGILLASLVFAWADPKLRRAVLWTGFHPLGWLLFLGISAPWFVAMEQAHPGHARFFFIHEHFARFSSITHDRRASRNPVLDKLFFLGVLAVGLLPWLSQSVVGFVRGLAFVLRRRGPQGPEAALARWTVATVVLGVLVPLGFFSLSGSKLAPYILPALVPMVALACALEREGEEPVSLKRHGLELILLGALLLFAAPGALKAPGGLAWVLAAGLAFLLLGAWALRPKGLTAARWMAALAVSLLLLPLAAERWVGADRSVIHRVRKAPAEAQWISHGYYHQGIAYVTGRRVVVVGGTGELEFGSGQLTDPERVRWFVEDLHSLNATARRMAAEAPERPVWALSERKKWNRVSSADQAAWDVVDEGRKVVLLRLR